MSAARTKSKKSKKRTHRYTSNVFSMFNQAQIQEFKEAFNMIDQNRDGFVDKDDLIEMLTSLGKNPDDQLLDNMINEAPGAINFTMFLTLFGEKLNGTDPEDVIRNAFGCFDIKTTGVLPQERLREIMTTMGDRWTDEMVDELFYGAPIKEGLFDYIEFTRMLKHGARDKDEEQLDKQLDKQQPTTPTTPKSGGGFGFQNQPSTGSKIQPPPPKSPAVPASPQPAQKQQPFWKKPRAKSPPPKPKSPPPQPKVQSLHPKSQPAGPKPEPPTQKAEPPSPVKPPTPTGQSGKPDLPTGGKPQLPTLKSTLKVQPFQQIQAKLQTPALKPVLKSTQKNPPK